MKDLSQFIAKNFDEKTIQEIAVERDLSKKAPKKKRGRAAYLGSRESWLTYHRGFMIGSGEFRCKCGSIYRGVAVDVAGCVPSRMSVIMQCQDCGEQIRNEIECPK